jgi:hypothetical protein
LHEKFRTAAPRGSKDGLINEGAKTMSPRPGSRTVPPADADDLRVEHIVAQLEEAEQQRLADDWIKEWQQLAEYLTEKERRP